MPITSPIRSLLLLAALAGLVVLTFLHSFASMARMWEYSSYNHGYLVPLVSIYLIISERHKLAGLQWNGSWLGLGALVCVLVVWVMGRATAVAGIEHLALVSVMIACLWSIAGDALLRMAWFPLLYLYFATPVGEEIVPLLQIITADVSTAALGVFNIPAYREGMFIALPGGNFEVARACSGFRYLSAGLAMAALIAYWVLHSPWIRLLYIALVAALFVVVNGIRAFLVMWIASATDMRYMTGEDHIWLGYILFIMMAALSYWIAVQIERQPWERSRAQEGSCGV